MIHNLFRFGFATLEHFIDQYQAIKDVVKMISNMDSFHSLEPTFYFKFGQVRSNFPNNFKNVISEFTKKPR